jgi:hypothetical protein
LDNFKLERVFLNDFKGKSIKSVCSLDENRFVAVDEGGGIILCDML